MNRNEKMVDDSSEREESTDKVAKEEEDADGSQDVEEGEDDDDNTQSPRSLSWSGAGSLGDLLTTDWFSKPPIDQRRRSVEEERQQFHERNQKFLKKEKQYKQSDLAPSNSGTSNVSQPRQSWPSPGASFRKRLDSIEENEYMLNAAKVARSLPKTHAKRPSSGVPSSAHIRSYSDEMSEISQDTTQSSVASSVLHQQRMERFERYEQRQQEHFEHAKQGIRSKLTNALDRNFPPSEKEKSEFIREYMDELESERANLMAQWKSEMEAEQQAMEDAASPWITTLYVAFLQPALDNILSMLTALECFVANLPLTIGAVGLSWVTMGTVWFKYMEEMTDICVPVHFYSDRCTFPEFPGCFACDTSQDLYKLALSWHNTCSFVAGTCCVAFFLKTILAWKTVVDELSNPTTSTPIGVVCIATVCSFAGRGVIGEAIVLIASSFHFIMACWFLYMAVFQFRLWPDPGWFPNTVGLSYAAVKTWLYFPTPGFVLMILTLVFFFALFFISTVRVATNKKIAAPVAWIGLSAPSITLYCFTLISQPNRIKQQLLDSDSELRLRNHEWMATYYLGGAHFLMFLSLVGLVSAVHSFIVRWENFRHKPFSPAHVAFCFPTLSHTNAIQAYRGAVNAYSAFPDNGIFKTVLYSYWVFFLVTGTLLNIVFTAEFVKRLPEWTKVDTAGEDEPPAPNETFVHEMLDGTSTHEFLVNQPFSSPAVLQANEAGTLVRVRRGTEDYRIHGPYMRTRKVSAFGFDPTMSDEELRRERAELLDWVAKNAPRTRNRTMSNQSLIFKSSNVQQGNTASGDAYGTFAGRHKRSATSTGVPGV